MQSLSHAVVPASVAYSDTALPTLVDPVVVDFITHLALIVRVSPANAAEALMVVLVVLAQMVSELRHHLGAASSVLCRHMAMLSVDNVGGALEKSPFLPLRAGASLPLESANIAEFGPADASVDSQEEKCFTFIR